MFCLDNDDAGEAAVERLCSGNFLREAANMHAVQFCVASLPSGMKDPGDFIEGRREDDARDVAENFLEDVVQPAIDWSDWFLKKILSRYDAAATRAKAGSFGDVFQRVADFLSMFPNPADRTKGAYEVSAKLAQLIAKERNSTEISKAARMQLESDLIDSASRIAKEREAKKSKLDA